MKAHDMSLPLDSRQPRLAPVRGILAAMLGALGGALTPITILGSFTVCRWYFEGTPAIDRQWDLDRFQGKLLWPVIAFATVSSCAAWATVAPRGTYRFAKTLAIVFSVSLPLWFAPLLLGLSPRQPRKSADHPAIYRSELVVMIGAPLIATALLTAIRIYGSRAGRAQKPPQSSISSG
jgi:hypothetical protein